MKKEGCFAHSHICGHLSEDEVPDEKWQAIVRENEARRKDKTMTHPQMLREKVFRSVQHDYFTQDAINQVANYLDSENVPPDFFEGCFDYNT